MPDAEGNKYHRGFVAIYGALDLTGATRLAATACNRIGAGLVSVAAKKRQNVYRISLPPDIMVNDQRPAKATVVLGGSGGISSEHQTEMLALDDMKARIFDADALPQPEQFAQLDNRCVLTPHLGEFHRTFGAGDQNPISAAQAAARDSGAVVVLKGARTVIASPDGATVCNTHASPYLAKAGTGDVLAGLISGLAAQETSPFWAACMAVWIHGEAGRRLGAGLVASDIPEIIPEILQELLSSQG